MTLVALLAVTAGAWAEETPLVTIDNKEYTSFTSGSMTFDDKVTVTFSDEVYNDGDWYGWYTGSEPSLLTVAGINGYAVTSCKFYTASGTAANGYTVEGKSPSVYLSWYYVYTDDSKSVNIGFNGVTKIEVYGTAPASVPLIWNATAKTARIASMPAGNVTVNVKYYPQATAVGAVTAATGAIATTDAPLVTIDPDMLTGADGMMYYVSETNTAPDYTTDGWTTDVPNAKNYTEAKTLYLWYYPLGRVGQTADDIYSDGNMNAEPLELSVAPLPTYDIAVGAGNFATFCDMFNVMLDPQTPEGVGLYTINSIDDQRTTATLAKLNGVVAFNTPMIIYNGTGSEQSVKLKATTDEASDNNPKFIDQFVGESTDVVFEENVMAEYDFYLLSGGKAFAPVLGPGRLKAHQCYLIFFKQSDARTIQLVFEDATGITTVSGSPADAPLYDLNGRRVTKPAKKGVYIQNGRKVVR